jgi:RHS repeat-associated protein
VKETDGAGVTTVMIGQWHEKNINTGVQTTYYYAGNQRIAMRTTPGNVFYLVTDHLGSTSVTLNESGTKVAELRYEPYGEVRTTWGVTPTDCRFTGQRAEAQVKLLDYGARFYRAGIGRFMQPDTIVPDPANTQTLNRYACLRTPLPPKLPTSPPPLQSP